MKVIKMALLLFSVFSGSLALAMGKDECEKRVEQEKFIAFTILGDRVDLFEQLVQCGLDIHRKIGVKPLSHMAAIYDAKDILALLINEGVSVNNRSEGGSTILHEAAGTGRYEIGMWLINKGADPTLRDMYGTTPVDAAKGRNEQQQHKKAKQREFIEFARKVAEENEVKE